MSFRISLLAIIMVAFWLGTLGNVIICDLTVDGQGGRAISIKTDNPVYFPGDAIRVFGSLYDNGGSPVANASINIDAYPSEEPNEPKKIIYRTSIITDSNGKYSDDGLRISESDYGLVSSMMNFSKMSPNLFGRSYIVEASTSFGGFINCNMD